MRRQDLSDLLAFVTIAEEKSFARAAARLGVSSSALSHALRLLERRLDTQLLHRTTRAVAPTAAGERLLARLRPALSDIDAGLAELAEGRRRPAGRVRISVHRTAATLLIVPKLAQLRRDYPEIVVELAVEDALTDIVSAGFDAGIRNGKSLARDMVAVRVGRDYRTAVVGAPDYFEARPTPRSPDDLGGHACFGYRFTGSRAMHTWEFHRGRRKIQVPIEPVFVADDGDVLVQAALTGAGLAYVLHEQVSHHLASGTLVSVLDDWAVTVAGSFLYYPRQRQLPAAMRAVVEALRHR